MMMAWMHKAAPWFSRDGLPFFALVLIHDQAGRVGNLAL
jgi:hypothetical protein